jgi:hypothetical protein
MTPSSSKARRILLATCFFTLMVMPLSWVSGAALSEPEQRILAQIDFTPNILTLEAEATPEPILEDELVLPEVFIEGNVLVIDGKPFPIGDAFYDAAGIPMGATVTDRTGLYGYALIENMPSHVLTWYLDGRGRKTYLVTTADDPLMKGTTGFETQIENLQKSEDRMLLALGTEYTGVLTLVLLQAAGCAPTGGITCATAVVSAAVGVIGGMITGGALLIFDLLPAITDVDRAFSTIDSNNP